MLNFFVLLYDKRNKAMYSVLLSLVCVCASVLVCAHVSVRVNVCASVSVRVFNFACWSVQVLECAF